MSESKPLVLQINRYVVERDKEIIRVDIPEYEAEVIRAGQPDPNNVRLIEADVDAKEFNPSAHEEFDRLVRTYSRVNAPNPVGQFLRNGPRDLVPYGFTLERALVANPEAERVMNPREAAHRAKKAAAQAGKR